MEIKEELHEVGLSEIKDSDITATGVLIVNQFGYILAFARNMKEDKLGLIAGGREKGEDLRTCAQREAEEETGLKNLAISAKPFFIRKANVESRGYCAIFLAKYNGYGPFPLANQDSTGNPEGYAFWLTPQEFIDSKRSAFQEFNTELLKKADSQGIINL